MNTRYYTNQIVMFVVIAILYVLGRKIFAPELSYAWKNRNGFVDSWSTLSVIAGLLGIDWIARFCQKKADQDWEDYVLNYK